MKNKVVSFKSLPMKIPIQETFLGYLLADHFHVNDFAWGVLICCAIFVWACWLYSCLTCEYVELFPKK